jgi:ABC-type polysaccharide/polyol phosphate transport system ATPase subunit
VRLGRRHRVGAHADLDGDGVVAEDLSKAYHDIADRAFEAPTPVLTRAFRGRRPSGFDEEVQEDDDDDDDGAEDDEGPEASIEEDRAPTVWALRGATFRIPRGAAVALVGGRGSGKTTLLRVLAGAVPPTSGRAMLAGRPSPLINVSVQLMAATLAPEANAAVAAALVGTSKRRLRPRLEEILALAEVTAQERRLGVTRSPYRIAVASALVLSSEVLLLDDPFALANSAFRERVLEAIERRHAEGATVVIETGDREALRRLCDRAVWLDGGVVAGTGPIAETLAAYDAAAVDARRSAPSPESTAGFNETAAIVSACGEADPGGKVSVDLRLELARTAVTIQTGVGLERGDGVGLWFEQPDAVICELPGFHRFQLVAYEVPPGRYSGRVQARVLEGGLESVIARRGVFELTVGAPEESAHKAREITWERHEASWQYEPEQPAV